MIEIVAYGIPGPQGSKRYVGKSKKGKAIMIESSEKVKPWRKAVESAALEASRVLVLDGKSCGESNPRAVVPCKDPRSAHWIKPPPLDVPLVVRMVFTMPKPKSAPEGKRTFPMRMPDLSKLARSTEDALTDAGIWRDDARVVEYQRLAKVYPSEDPEALDAPGVRIRIEALDAVGVARKP